MRARSLDLAAQPLCGDTAFGLAAQLWRATGAGKTRGADGNLLYLAERERRQSASIVASSGVHAGFGPARPPRNHGLSGAAFRKVGGNFILRLVPPHLGLAKPIMFALQVKYRTLPAHLFLGAVLDNLVHGTGLLVRIA
jgi:hypothetical protein